MLHKVQASFYIAQYPVLGTVQSALHFTSLTDLFTQTPSRFLWEASNHMLQLMREGCSYTYPPLSIARYSFIQLSELEQCRVKKLAEAFNTAAQDSNPGSRSRESEALPLSHCALWTSWWKWKSESEDEQVANKGDEGIRRTNICQQHSDRKRWKLRLPGTEIQHQKQKNKTRRFKNHGRMDCIRQAPRHFQR